MERDDFYSFDAVVNAFGLDDFVKTGLNSQFINDILNKQYPKTHDIEVLSNLLSILKDELVAYANAGNKILSDQELSFLVRSIRVILNRQNLSDLKLPFSNFSEFYNHWRSIGLTGSGSWEARRNYISSLLDGSILEVKEKQDTLIFDDLVNPTNDMFSLESWDSIFDEIRELRVRYCSARTPQDFSSVGTACVRVIEGISRVAYIHEIHGNANLEEPPVSKTDIRIGQIISVDLGGRANEELRALAKSSSAVAHKVKHSTTPNALQAGIACDAVILLSSIINRIENERMRMLTL